MFKRRFIPWLLAAAILSILPTRTGKVLAQSAICGPFSDVPSSSAFCPFILEAFVTNITQGTSASTFNPTDNVTREQAVTFTSRTMDQTLHRASTKIAIGKTWAPTSLSSGVSMDAGAPINDIVSDGINLWVARNDGKVAKFSAADRRQIEVWGMPSGIPRKLGIFGGLVWIADANGSLYAFNPSSPATTANLAQNNQGIAPGGPTLAFDGTSVWWASAGGTKIFVSSLAVPGTTTFSPSIANIDGLVFDGTYMWALAADSHLLRLSIPAPGATPSIVETLSLPGVVSECRMVYDGNNIWIPVGGAGTLYVVRPSASPGATPSTIVKNEIIPDVAFPYVASFDGEYVMVGGQNNGSVALYRATTLARIRTFSSGASGVRGIASDGRTFNVGDIVSTKFFQF